MRAPRSFIGVASAVSWALWAAAASADDLRADPPFGVDPVSDGVVTATAVGMSTVLGAVLGTGEIRPQAPGSPRLLLPIDRLAVTQTLDPNASTYSDIVLWTSTGFAVLDPILSWFRDGFDAALVDGAMYAESTALASAMTDMLKIAVRRPRPIDYLATSTTSTNAVLSFPSGHASGVASVAATATYLAFVRAPRSPRPWITLGVSILLSVFVDYERVRAGQHFPTDVTAGTLLGGTIGVLVPHLHRRDVHAPPVMIGVSPSPEGRGGSVTLRLAL